MFLLEQEEKTEASTELQNVEKMQETEARHFRVLQKQWRSNGDLGRISDDPRAARRRLCGCGAVDRSDGRGSIMTASELQAAILATQKQIANTMSPMRKRDLQRHLARLRRKLRAVERRGG